MNEKEKLILYKKWLDNYSFFGNNNFVIKEIDFLWEVSNIIKQKFKNCTNLDLYKFSSLDKEENIELVQRFFDNHNIDLKLNELIKEECLIFENDEKTCEKYLNIHSDGVSSYDKKKTKKF